MVHLPDQALRHLQHEYNIPEGNVFVQTLPSAQQVMWLVKRIGETTTAVPASDSTSLTAPLESSSTWIIRQWKSSSTWWNLHQNSHQVQEMARSEVAGYTVARQLLVVGDEIDPRTSNGVFVPRVLRIHSSTGTSHQKPDQDPDSPWAVLEYIEEKPDSDSQDCGTWRSSMIHHRLEYGFMEPHPRWGRVPQDSSLEYALLVLSQVIIPLHTAMNSLVNHNVLGSISSLNGFSIGGYYFQTMVGLYRTKIQLIETRRAARATDGSEVLKKACQEIHRAIHKLENTRGLTYLRPVICHMDLQPQNLLFYSPKKIAAVLDWEDASYADPRFELLLLCRKVCANKEQGKVIWNAYQKSFPSVELGDLDIWLELETVHSLTTLLLQSMDLLGGGRSPWESKPDLLGKIERELVRLQDYDC